MRIKVLILMFWMHFCFCDSIQPTPIEVTKNTPQENVIYTYGGGKVLNKIFSAISMFIYGKDKQLFRAILITTALIGGFWAFCLSLFGSSFEPLIKQFFLPILVLSQALIVPKTTIHIVDVTIIKSPDSGHTSISKVDNVPFILGKFASLVSTIGFKITNALESLMHTNNNPIYNWTGRIYAGQNLFETSKYKIQDSNLETNFREFVRQCVFYDVKLGLYTKDQLKSTPDLFNFLKNNTSNIRTVQYIDLTNSKQSTKSFCSCRKAAENMEPIFSNQSQLFLRNNIFAGLKNTYSFLINQSDKAQLNQEKLIQQQLAMNIMKQEYPGSNVAYASKRAQYQQRETQKILGNLGVHSIVSMRNVFEALIYAAFIFIIPLAFFPSGLKYLGTWSGLVMWIQLWPPFYVILDFIIQTIWEIRKKGILGTESSLNLFTSDGLINLYENMEAIASLMILFVPFLSYILLKGGVASFVHLASSVTSPAHSAASMTATEQTYGNYSLANVNMGNTQGFNASNFKQDFAGKFASGFVQEETGQYATTHTLQNSDAPVFHQKYSNLSTNIHRTEAFQSSLNSAYQETSSKAQALSETVAQNLSQASTNTLGFIESLANSYQSSASFSSSNSLSKQESAQYVLNTLDHLANQYGVDRKTATEGVLSGSLGISFLGSGTVASARASSAAGHSDLYQTAKSISESSQFQEHWQNASSLTSTESSNLLNDAGQRLHTDAMQSWNETKTSMQQLQDTQTQLESISKTSALSESNNLAFQENLNQDFVNYVYKVNNDSGRSLDILSRSSSDPEKQQLIQDFAKGLTQEPNKYLRSETVDQFYTSKSQERHLDEQASTFSKPDHENFQKESASQYQQAFEKMNIKSTTPQDLSGKAQNLEQTVQDQLKKAQTNTKNSQQEMSKEMDDKINSYSLINAFQGPDSNKHLKNPIPTFTQVSLGFIAPWFNRKKDDES